MPDMPFIMPMPPCMAFMWSAISAWRSSGVLAFFILMCMSCMVFICTSIAAMRSGLAMLLAGAAPIGIAGAVVQAINVLAEASATARETKRKRDMSDSWLEWVR